MSKTVSKKQSRRKQLDQARPYELIRWRQRKTASVANYVFPFVVGPKQRPDKPVPVVFDSAAWVKEILARPMGQKETEVKV